MPGTKRFNLAIKTSDGELPPTQIEVSDEPMRLSEIVPLLHELANKTIGLAIERSGREGKAVSCKAGCGVCCRQLVPVAPAEAFYIVEKLMALPLADRRGPLEKFQENEKRLADTGLLSAIADLGRSRDNNAVARQYFRLGLPCPFLENQSCSIHAWRPLACREYNVVTPDAHCADPFRMKIEAIPLYRRMSESLGRLSSHVAQLPAGMVPMPLLFDYFEEHKEASRECFPGAELLDLALDFAFGKRDL
jgi:Fe-S-cluster containining protein